MLDYLVRFTHTKYVGGGWDNEVETILVRDCASFQEACGRIAYSKKWDTPRDFANLTLPIEECRLTESASWVEEVGDGDPERVAEFMKWLQEENLKFKRVPVGGLSYMFRVWERLSYCDCGRDLSRGLCRVCDNDE